MVMETRLPRQGVIRFACLAVTTAIAMAPAFGAPPPQRTTATYQDWTVRCDIEGATKTCEMVQTTQDQGRGRPVTLIAIGRRDKGSPLKIVVQVPVNVSLSAGIKLTTPDNTAVLAASFDRCVPAGCVAEADVPDKLIATLRVLKTNGELRFTSAGRQDVTIPVSFNGFGDAHDAMLK
jgi:invasion protein IalB